MTNRTNSAGFLEPSQIQAYLKGLKKEGASPATLKRKEAALKKFQSWREKEYGPKYPLPKGAPKPKRIISKGIPPKAFPPFLRYFSFLIGLVLLAGLGWGIYHQFFAQPKETPSMALPTNPPLLISFQGQLTDEVGTPINATVSATFRLYNVDEGGNALWEEQKNVSTDQDGIFNTFLGDTTTLDPAIFRDNMNLWLAIEIDSDGEMEPRQQIATVGYAFNSRYLQGYEATTAATANTIPVINAAGDLILASSSPTVEATSGTFGLKGEAITIQSTGGTGGGDILIQPDADTQGQVIIYSATAADNSFTVQNSNITTGSLIYGDAGTSATGYNLLKLASGSPLTDKFVVDYAGNTDITGNLTVNSSGFFAGNVGVGTTSPSAPLSVGSSSQFQVDNSGDIVKLKNLTYSWPSSHTINGFLKDDGSGNLSWSTDITATSMKWNALTNPDGNLSLSHQAYTTTFTWDMATTAGAFTGLTLGLGNDATTDSTTQRILALQNNLATGGTTENLLYLNNADDNVVGNAIEIANTGTGGFTNFLDTPSLDISGTGAITGATGISSSGTITFSSLAANRLVTTTTGGELTTSTAGTAGQPLLSGGASSPSWGTLGLVYGGTNADLSGVAQGGLIYKGASALAGTGALTGMLKGNGASAPTAITSTTGYVTYWQDANTITGEQYLATSRGGLGGNMTAAGAGELIYSTAATTYGHLAAGTSGQILKSGGAAVPTWNTPAALTKTDDTNVTLTLGGSPSTALVNAASLTLGWSGQLSAARGGTGDDTSTTTGVPYISMGNWLYESTLALSRGGTNKNMTASAGSVVYSDADSLELTGVGSAGQVLTSAGTGAPTWTDPAGLGVKWSSLQNPTDNLSLSHQAYTTTFTWGAATGTNNLFTLTDTANNTGTGYLLNLNTASGSTLKPLRVASAGVEALAIDATGNVGIGTTSPGAKLDVNGTGRFATSVSSPLFQGDAGAVTFGNASYATTIAGSGLTISPTAWTATPTISGLITATSGLTANGALTANSTFTLGDGADAGSVNTSSWDISTTGVASGFTGLTSSGTITFSSLAANRLVTTTTGGQLTTSAAGTAGQPLLSGGASSPSWGTLGLVYGGTNADLSSVAQGGLIYKGASALAGTGALTGILQGNNASAPTAITGTANYLPKWSSTAPYLTAASQIFDNGANVGIGNANPQALLHVGAGGAPNYASSGDVYIQNNLEVDGTIYGTLDVTDAAFDFLEVKRAATFSAQIASDIPITVKNTSGTEVARLTNEGKLRLGSAGAPTDTLDVDGDADIAGNLDVNNGLDVLGANFTVGGANFTVSQAGTVTGGTYNGQTISSTASFTGTLSVASTFSANGNVGLGNQTTDTINAAGQFISDLIPQTSTYNLGSSANHWGALYVDSIYGGQVGEFDFLKARGATLSAEVATDKTLVLEGLASGHTANLIEATANGATALTLSPAGNLTLGGTITLPNSNTLTGVASYAQFNQGISVGGATTYRLTSAGDAYLNNLYTGGTQRLSSAGALANITDYSQSSGNFTISGTGTFSTATGNISLNGATTVADGKSFTANGPVTLGDGGDAVAINSNIWDITSAGVASGLTQLTVDNLQLDGNTLSSTTGNLTLDAAANLVIADQIASSLIPSATNTYDLGSPENYWDDAYINTLTANSLNFDFIAARGATFSAEIPTDKTLVLNAAAGQTANLLEINSAPGASGDLMVVTGGGNVGIGTTNPGTYKLDAAGAGRFNSTANPGLTVGSSTIGYLKIGGSTIYDNNSDLTLDSDTALVILADDLQINGNDIYDSGANQRINLGATTTLYNTTTTFSGTATLTASSLATFTTASSLAMPATTSLTLGGSATIYGGAAASEALTLQSTSNATKGNILINPSGGNVGVGTTTPGAKLDVNGNLKIATLTTGATNTVLIHNGNIVQQRTIDSRVWGAALVDYSGTSANYIPKMLDADTITNSLIYEAANGRIGISTTSPGSKLTVAGGASYFGALPAPTGVVATPTSGGGLVAGTYYYVVNAFDSNNLSSNKSSQVSCTVDGSTTTACQISWVAVPGAANYRVYGRASNAQNQYWQTTSLYYTDTGAAGVSDTPPGPISAFFTGNIKAERFADSANDTYYLDPAYATLSLTTAGAAGIGYSAGQMSGSTAKLAVDGNVGIGTTTPEQKLEVYGGHILVNGAGLTDPTIQFRDGTAVRWSLGMDDQSLGSGNPFIFSNGDGLGSPIMTLKSGNVGIGTTGPTHPLQVEKTGVQQISVVNPSATNDTYPAEIYFDRKAITGGTQEAAVGVSGTSRDFFIWVNGEDRLNITDTGNVGIGTTEPSATLHVVNTSTSAGALETVLGNAIGDHNFWVVNKKGVTTNNPGDITSKLGLAYNGTIDNAFIRFHRGSSQTGGFLSFSTNNDTEAVRITDTGNVGIGTTGPNTELSLNHGYINFEPSLTSWLKTGGEGILMWNSNDIEWLESTYESGYGHRLYSIDPGAGAVTHLRLAARNNSASWTDMVTFVSNGNVGIGTTGPQHKLHIYTTTAQEGIIINAGTYPEIRFEEAGTVRGYLSVAGSAGGYGTGTLADSMILRAEGNMHLITNAGTVVQTLTSGGNVGIGTTGPGAKLSINGSPAIEFASCGTSYGGCYIKEGWGPELYSNTSQPFQVLNTSLLVGYDQTDSTARGSGNLLVSGNVGIGTTGPGAVLHTYRSSPGATHLIYAQRGGDNPAGSDFYHWYSAYGPVEGGIRGNAAYEWNTNIWSTQDLNLGAGGAGNLHLTIDKDSGNVGIGTTGPSKKLHVVSSGNAYMTFDDVSGLQVYNAESSTAEVRLGAAWDRPGVYSSQQLELFSGTTGIIFGTSNVEYMRLTSGGNLGIGTSSPGYKLDVNGTLMSQDLGIVYQNDNCLFNTQEAGDVRVTFPSHYSSATGSFGTFLISFNNRAGQSSYILQASKQYDSVMTVTMTKVGGNLDAGFEYVTRTVDQTVILIKQNISTGTHQSSTASFTATLLEDGGGRGRATTFSCQARAAGWTYPPLPVNYLGSGNVGIGTTSPGAKLQVNGEILLYGNYDLTLKSSSTDPGDLIFQNSSGTEYGRVYSDSSGAIRLSGGSNTDAELTAYDSGAIYFNSGIGNRTSQYHQLHIDAGTWEVFRYSSSRKLKSNITDLEIDSSKIYDLHPVSFTPNDNPDIRNFGFIAEEAIEIIPDLVLLEADGSPGGFRYADLSVLILNEMIKQKPIIDNISLESIDDFKPKEASDSAFSLVKKSTEKIIKNAAVFAELATAKVYSGLVETTNLITDNLTAKRITSEEVISPLIETEEIKFSENSRLRQGSDGQAKVAIVNSQDEPTAEFNTETKETTLFGDLEVAGNVGIGQEVSAPKANFGDLLAQKINADEIQANTIHADTAQISADATISGTLYVDRVVARQGGFGELLAENLSVDNTGLNGIENEVSTQDRTGLGQEEEFNLQALLAKVEAWAGTSVGNDLPLECAQDGTGLGENQQAHGIEQDGENLCLIDTDLTVLGGRTSLANTSIAGQLSVGSLVINNNSLDVLGGTLYIQKLSLGGLDILNGKLTVDIDGNVFIAAHLTVGGGLATNEIRPMEGGDLTFNLENTGSNGIEDQEAHGMEQDEETGFGKLLVKGINNETVASIDASGTAKFKKVSADLLEINTNKEASQSGEVIIAAAENFENIGILAPGLQTNATAGEATLPAGEKEIVIYNDKLTDQSLVYLTPTADTENKILYVKEKVSNTNQEHESNELNTNETNGGYFVVGLNEALGWDVRFNWWIIN